MWHVSRFSIPKPPLRSLSPHRVSVPANHTTTSAASWNSTIGVRPLLYHFSLPLMRHCQNVYNLLRLYKRAKNFTCFDKTSRTFLPVLTGSNPMPPNFARSINCGLFTCYDSPCHHTYYTHSNQRCIHNVVYVLCHSSLA